jgi:hypothetical protein
MGTGGHASLPKFLSLHTLMHAIPKLLPMVVTNTLQTSTCLTTLQEHNFYMRTTSKVDVFGYCKRGKLFTTKCGKMMPVNDEFISVQ